MKRGDVVIIDFPYSDRTGSKVRPSLVVQSDTLNPIRDDSILAIITSMSSGRPDTEILIEVTFVVLGSMERPVRHRAGMPLARKMLTYMPLTSNAAPPGCPRCRGPRPGSRTVRSGAWA